MCYTIYMAAQGKKYSRDFTKEGRARVQLWQADGTACIAAIDSRLLIAECNSQLALHYFPVRIIHYSRSYARRAGVALFAAVAGFIQGIPKRVVPVAAHVSWQLHRAT